MDFTSEFAERLNMKSIRFDVYENNRPAIKKFIKKKAIISSM